MIGIVAALPEEIAPFLARVRGARRAGRRVWRGRIGSADVCVATTGEGLDSAAESVTRILRKFPFRALVGIGIAGALSPGLREGEIFAAREVRGAGGAVFRPEESWLARAARLSERVGIIVSSGDVRWTAAEKAELFARQGDAGEAAADTESAAWASAAGEARVPFVAVRAILDPASEDLPAYLKAARRDGATDRAAIVRHALRHPRSVPELLELRRRTRRAMARLAGAVALLVSESA
jgi:adenosylhomocysteine nucleosidase